MAEPKPIPRRTTGFALGLLTALAWGAAPVDGQARHRVALVGGGNPAVRRRRDPDPHYVERKPA